MPIVANDLVFYSSASVPTDDASTTGGAIDTASRVALTQHTGNQSIRVVSDGADTRTVTITGRLASGVVDTEVLTLNGTTPVNGSKSFERIQSLVASTTNATRTITIRTNEGSPQDIATITPNESKRHMQFQNSTSEGSTAVRYEKQFAKNTHATLSLLNAALKLTADPASKIEIGVGTAVNGSTNIANRKAAPAGITFVDDNVSQGVPGTNLAAGDACPFWVKQTLGANDAAQKSTFTTELAGSTT